MTIPAELAARIERLYTVERWRVGTIARQLNVHRDTVRRVLREHQVVPPGTPLRQSLFDPYRSFIRETLEKYPTLAASRLHDMVCERGYGLSYHTPLCSGESPAKSGNRVQPFPRNRKLSDSSHVPAAPSNQPRRSLFAV